MENKVIQVLKKNSNGLTIGELVEKSKIVRSKVRIILAKLEGAEKVSVRKAGMAKIYTLTKKGRGKS